MSGPDWKQWARLYLSAAKDGETDPRRRTQASALRSDLDAALKADPLHVGVRTDADLKAAASEAAEVADSEAAWAVLRSRLARLIDITTQWDLETQPDDRAWLVADWLPAGRAGMLVGTGGTGKSKLALQLAIAIASGQRDWLPAHSGYWSIMGTVNGHPDITAVASWEDEKAEARRRMYWLFRSLRWNLKGLGNRFHWIDARKLGPLWGPVESGSRHVATTGSLTEAGAKIRAHCQRVSARLLILDPLAAVYGSDENVRALVRAFMASWDAWAQENGCTVMLVAHPPKTQGATYSGSTDWQGAARWLWELAATEIPGQQRTGTKGIRLRLDKSNYGRSGAETWLRMINRGAAWQQCSPQDSANALPRQEPDEEFNDEEPAF